MVAEKGTSNDQRSLRKHRGHVSTGPQTVTQSPVRWVTEDAPAEHKAPPKAIMLPPPQALPALEPLGLACVESFSLGSLNKRLPLLIACCGSWQEQWFTDWGLSFGLMQRLSLAVWGKTLLANCYCPSFLPQGRMIKTTFPPVFPFFPFAFSNWLLPWVVKRFQTEFLWQGNSGDIQWWPKRHKGNSG